MKNKIEPNLTLQRFGLGDGWITITDEAVSITACPGKEKIYLPIGHDDDSFESNTIVIDPSYATLFRMIAKRLDSIAKNVAG